MEVLITASLGLTREAIRQALIEAGISPTTRRMEDAINYIRVTVKDWAAPALTAYVEHHADYVPLEKRNWQ